MAAAAAPTLVLGHPKSCPASSKLGPKEALLAGPEELPPALASRMAFIRGGAAAQQAVLVTAEEPGQREEGTGKRKKKSKKGEGHTGTHITIPSKKIKINKKLFWKYFVTGI